MSDKEKIEAALCAAGVLLIVIAVGVLANVATAALVLGALLIKGVMLARQQRERRND